MKWPCLQLVVQQCLEQLGETELEDIDLRVRMDELVCQLRQRLALRRWRTAQRRKELQELEDQQKAAQKATPKEPGNKRTAPEEPSFINEEGSGEDGWVNQTGRYELCGVISHKGREADGGGRYRNHKRQAGQFQLRRQRARANRQIATLQQPGPDPPIGA